MKQTRWMIWGIAGAVLVGTALIAADAKKPKEEHNPVGYSDTPVLPGQKWKVHDIDRPRPKVVTPAAAYGQPPSDAIVLFDGKDFSHWDFMKRGKSSGQTWTLKDGYMEVKPGAGDAVSKEKFGDAQYHIEWASPTQIGGNSQLRGNSGILIMQRYEIQVLDSSNNLTYADGQAGAIYGQWPPLVNAARKPGEWQAYDIVWEAPKFEGDKVVKPAYATVFLNGIVLHNRKEVIGRMAHRVVGTYAPHDLEESLALQDHSNGGGPVRYRNIWVRRIGQYDQP